MCLEDDVDLKLQYLFSYAKMPTFLVKNTRGETELRGIKANFGQHIAFLFVSSVAVGLRVRNLFTWVRPDCALRDMRIVILDSAALPSKAEWVSFDGVSEPL